MTLFMAVQAMTLFMVRLVNYQPHPCQSNSFYYCNWFLFDQVSKQYNLRNNDDYRTQRCRLQTSSKSFFPSTIKLWNSLPDSVKSLPTFSKFKKAIQPVQIPVASFYNIGDRSKCTGYINYN
jgi:hypothetical protein